MTAQVDPERVLLLDVNYTNNSWTLRPDAARGGTEVDLCVVRVAAGRAADVGVAGLRNAPVTDRPHRAPLTLVADGLRRVWRAPAILCGVWAVTAIVALRPAADLHRTIAGDLGSSMAASSAANGVNWTWWQEFTARQPAFAETFQPHIIGFASVLTNVSAFVSAVHCRAR